EGGTPAGEAGAKRAVDVRPVVRVACGRGDSVRGGRLAPRVRDEQAPVRGRDAHARERIGEAGSRGPILEAEAEMCRVRCGAARPRHVDVQLVGVLVVRDEEVRPSVTVHVEELRAEAVAEGRALETGCDADLAEASAAL